MCHNICNQFSFFSLCCQGSTSSSMSDHWLIRLNEDSKRGSMVSRTSTTFPPSIPDSPESPVFLEDDTGKEKGNRLFNIIIRIFLDVFFALLGTYTFSLFLLLGGCERRRPFVRGLQGRSVSMRAPSKAKDALSKVFPLRWSLGSKDRRKPEPTPPSIPETGPVELVQYLESGRRPRCTKDPIVTLMSEPRSKNDASDGQAAANPRSSNRGGMSCVSKAGQDSPQIPEGQRRPSEKTASLRRGKANETKDDTVKISSNGSNGLTKGKDGTKQSVSKGLETKRRAGAGIPPSHSTPSLQDGTPRRQKGTESERLATDEGNSRARREEVPNPHESLLSFLKGSFLKKDKDWRRSREVESSRGSADEASRKNLSRPAFLNGAAGGRGKWEEAKSAGSDHAGDGMANGKAGRTAASIKRSQSSSNIPTKQTEQTQMHRTASLHRNGMPSARAPPRNLTADKPSYGTLQRTRYSTTSLGRKKTVPESSF